MPVVDDLFNFRIPPGIKIFRKILCLAPRSHETRLWLYRLMILLLTFASYTSFHMTRKIISVVKTTLADCPENSTDVDPDDVNCTSWISNMDGQPKDEVKRLEGVLDSSFLFSYAFFMFFSGYLAERMNLRYFLSLGMLFSASTTFLFGAAHGWKIHSFGYFVAVQLASGCFQTSGWPGVVTAVANWFGKGKKGLIFGIWNSHTSVGNILGSLIGGMYAEENWGLSFIVPAIIMGGIGFFVWLLLVPKPEDVHLGPENQPRTIMVAANSEEALTDSTRPRRRTRQQSGSETESLLGPAEYNTDTEGSRSKSPQPDGDELFLEEQEEEHAINFLGALKIPGVIEFSLCLFFAKLVSYTFLFWLPSFITDNSDDVSAETAAYLSTLFDVGGIMGGILAGLLADFTGKPASVCAVMLVAAIPSLFGYNGFSVSCPLQNDVYNHCYYGNVGILLVAGLFVNGPYALITTAVSAELGTHPSLQGSSKALATVTAIIDGTGSIGAAIGPFLAGAIPGLDNVFYMLMGADVMALLLLSRLVYGDVNKAMAERRQRRRNELYNA